MTPSAPARTLFEALCRVHSTAPREDDARAAIARLVSELHPPGGRQDSRDHSWDTRREKVANPNDDELPSFSGASENPPMSGEGPPSAGGGRAALVDALLRTVGTYQSLLERYSRAFDAATERHAAGPPEATHEDDTIRLLRAAQVVLLKYPIAAQAAFASLVREGRLFAGTAAGAEWQRRLAASTVLAKARTMFEGLASGIVTERGAVLPSTFVDAFLRALDRDLEEVLAEVGGARP
jgi:hypothetical protein